MKSIFGAQFSWWTLALVFFAIAAFFARPDVFGYEKVGENSFREIDKSSLDAHPTDDFEDGDGIRAQKIIDGDTITLTTGEKVRLLGIDTPERGEDYYAEASEKLRELVWDKDLRLEKDTSNTDRYGRLLRHIYVGDLWVNREMIAQGYAHMVTFQPDNDHVEAFRAAQREARSGRRGLWE